MNKITFLLFALVLLGAGCAAAQEDSGVVVSGQSGKIIVEGVGGTAGLRAPEQTISAGQTQRPSQKLTE